MSLYVMLLALTERVLCAGAAPSTHAHVLRLLCL